MIFGWSQMKVGLRHFDSRNSPTSLSSRRYVVSGGEHSTLCFLHSALRKSFVS